MKKIFIPVLYLFGLGVFWSGAFFLTSILAGAIIVKTDLESACFVIVAAIVMGVLALLQLVLQICCTVSEHASKKQDLIAVQDGRSVYVRQGKKIVATATLDNEDPLSEEELNSILELVRKHREAKS